MAITAVNLIQIAHVPFRSVGLMMKAKLHFQAIRGSLIYLFVFLILFAIFGKSSRALTMPITECAWVERPRFLGRFFVPFLSGHTFRRGIPEIYGTVYFHEGNIVRFSKLPGYPRQVLVPVGFILLSLTCFPV